MANLKTMYPGVANSPDTFLKEDLAKDATIMYLADGSVLGMLPTLAVIGEDKTAETVLVTSTRPDGGFVIERGVEGEQKAWKKADLVVRNWTNKDYEALRSNITAINNEVETKLSKTDVVNDLTTGGADKVLSAEQGKVLFTYADNGKKSIADAIVGKGVDATKSDSFGVLADKISKIKTGYGVGDVIPEENLKVVKKFVAGQPQKIWEFEGHAGGVKALAIGPDGSIYSGGSDKKVFKISPDGKKIWEFAGYASNVSALTVGPDGSIYSGSWDKKVFKISPDGEKTWEFTGHVGYVYALAVGPGGSI